MARKYLLTNEIRRTVRAHLQMRGLRQRDIAAREGVPQSTLARLLSDRKSDGDGASAILKHTYEMLCRICPQCRTMFRFANGRQGQESVSPTQTAEADQTLFSLPEDIGIAEIERNVANGIYAEIVSAILALPDDERWQGKIDGDTALSLARLIGEIRNRHIDE